MCKSMRKITVFFALLSLGACTITKRVHHAGWHVEWRSKNLKTQELENENNLDVSAVNTSQKVDENYVQGEVEPDQMIVTNDQSENSTLVKIDQGIPLVRNEVSKAKSSPSKVLLNKSLSEQSDFQEPRVVSDQRNLALISLYFLVSAIVLPSLALLYCDMGWGVLAIASGFIGALAIFTAFILSIIALIRIYKNVDQRSNKKIAWTVAIVSLVFLLPILGILFLLFYAC